MPKIPTAKNPKTDPYAIHKGTGGYVHRYGLVAGVPMQPWMVEMYCGAVGGPLGRGRHLRNSVKLAFPDIEINPWLDWQITTFCADEYAKRRGGQVFRAIGEMGCAAAGKTFGSALLAFTWWLPFAHESIVILTSTTKDKIRQRVWPVINSLFYELEERYGPLGPHMMASKTMLQSQKGDDKHSIFAQAVRDGETQKAIENIKGQHAPRMMVVIDEAPMTPEAVLEVIPNLRKGGCREFIVLAIGNALSHLDPLGLFCEPEQGWKSVTVEDTEWRTKGVNTREHPWQVEGGVCLHFDGAKSPNVVEKKTVWKHIYSWEDWLTATATAEGRQTIQHWSNDRGFPAPEGVLRTVLSEALVDAHDGRGKHIFTSYRTPCASLDPSLGGDACTAYFGAWGDIAPEKIGIQIYERIIIRPEVNKRDAAGKPVPIEYQVARAFAAACDARGVKPQNSGIEGDGIGHAIASIAISEWGEIVIVYSGGAASDMPASQTDLRPSKEVYDRRITELCFTLQGFLKADQLKGLTEDAIIQGCAREYKPMGGRMSVEKKEDLQAKIGRSCDDLDAVCILCEVVRQKTGGPSGTMRPKHKDDWQKFARQADSVYDTPRIDDSDEEARTPQWVKDLAFNSSFDVESGE